MLYLYHTSPRLQGFQWLILGARKSFFFFDPQCELFSSSSGQRRQTGRDVCSGFWGVKFTHDWLEYIAHPLSIEQTIRSEVKKLRWRNCFSKPETDHISGILAFLFNLYLTSPASHHLVNVFFWKSPFLAGTGKSLGFSFVPQYIYVAYLSVKGHKFVAVCMRVLVADCMNRRHQLGYK